MIPHSSRGLDSAAANFRTVKESESVDMGSAPMGSRGPSNLRVPKGVPLDSALPTPGGDGLDPFLEFNSVTLHHDGDDHHHEGDDHHHEGNAEILRMVEPWKR